MLTIRLGGVLFTSRPLDTFRIDTQQCMALLYLRLMGAVHLLSLSCIVNIQKTQKLETLYYLCDLSGYLTQIQMDAQKPKKSPFLFLRPAQHMHTKKQMGPSFFTDTWF